VVTATELKSTRTKASERWIQRWVNELATPSDTTGLAKCPFAKKAWDQGSVKVVESQNLWDVVHREIQTFGEHRVVLCIQKKPDQRYEELEAACLALNRWFAFTGKDMWLLSYQTDKTIVFIQALSELDVASTALEKLGYYKDYCPEDYDRLIGQRRFLRKGVDYARTATVS